MYRWRVEHSPEHGWLSQFEIGQEIETPQPLENYEREGWVTRLTVSLGVDGNAPPPSRAIKIGVQDIVTDVEAK